MDEKTLTCELLTQMFSYGAYGGTRPEIRSSEIKGMMHYVYRIACPADLKTLSADEADLFGGAAGSSNASGTEMGHVSPVRLRIRTVLKTDRMKLLLHKEKANDWQNPELCCLRKGETFELTISRNDYLAGKLGDDHLTVGLEWYTDLIVLTLMLCGLGRRSRKGRGSVAVREWIFGTMEETRGWICSALNRIARTSSRETGISYEIRGEEICIVDAVSDRKSGVRPLIQRIRFGKKLRPDQTEVYFSVIDKACHDAANVKDTGAIGFHIEKAAIGLGRPRLASPLIISLVQTKEGLFPVYTFVRGILKGRTVDDSGKDRELFINLLEARMGGKGK